MNKYYNYHPKNFANEYTTIITTNKDEEKKLLDWWQNLYTENGRFYRVTVKELSRLKSEEAWRRKTDRAFSGYCNPGDPVTVDEFLCPLF